MCDVLAFVLFFINFAQVTAGVFPALTETLFFSSIDSFFLLFPFSEEM